MTCKILTYEPNPQSSSITFFNFSKTFKTFVFLQKTKFECLWEFNHPIIKGCQKQWCWLQKSYQLTCHWNVNMALPQINAKVSDPVNNADKILILQRTIATTTKALWLKVQQQHCTWRSLQSSAQTQIVTIPARNLFLREEQKNSQSQSRDVLYTTFFLILKHPGCLFISSQFVILCWSCKQCQQSSRQHEGK